MVFPEIPSSIDNSIDIRQHPSWPQFRVVTFCGAPVQYNAADVWRCTKWLASWLTSEAPTGGPEETWHAYL